MKNEGRMIRLRIRIYIIYKEDQGESLSRKENIYKTGLRGITWQGENVLVG